MPQAGLFYYYGDFWKAYFESLGYKVIFSKETNENIRELGSKYADSECCLPMKLMIGHAADLIEKTDEILALEARGSFFRRRQEFICPYFLGLGDFLKSIFPGLKIRRASFTIENGEILSEGLNKKAYDYAIKKTNNQKNKTSKSKKQIAVVGRKYFLQEKYLTNEIYRGIKKEGFGIIFPDNLSYSEKIEGLKNVNFPYRSHFYMTNDLVGSIGHFLSQEDVLGIIYLMPFSCGPDSMVEYYIGRDVRLKKPFTVISLDEMTGMGGINTRLEAFLDLIL